MDYYFEKLREGGFKLTPRREAIIKLFIKADTHLSPEDVWNKLKKQFDRCGFPSVYRNLESLVECGILTRIQQFDRKKHYGVCTLPHDRHHHHIICVKCGKVEEITDCAIENRKKINGYKVVSHFMQVDGVCAQCLM